MSMFKSSLRTTYFTLLDTTYNINMPCTWFLLLSLPPALATARNCI